jgi:hypothetical protein
MKYCIPLCTLLFCVTGCKPSGQTQASSAELTQAEKEIVIFESVLRDRYGTKAAASTATGRELYLTCTPKSQWKATGQWEDYPDSFYSKLSDMPVKFNKATEAVLTNWSVKDRKSGEPGYMIWLSINKWISKTEVEVVYGMWTEALWSETSICIYVNKDGKWQFKKLIESLES